MSLLKYIDRLKRMDDLMKREVTGTSKEFAEKLGISRSMLMENLTEFKELGAEISFCHFRRTYHYTNKFSIVIGRMKNIKGGHNFYDSPIALDSCILI
ncbi:MAG: hypothetical protein QM734_12605 [Cyclobacteriaceae bacterium]